MFAVTMKTLRACLVGWAVIAATGCGPAPISERQPPQPETSAVRHVKLADLGVQVGEYLPALEGGQWELAAPSDWDWRKPPDDNYLVGFILAGRSGLNDLPRILVRVEPAAGFSMATLDQQNVAELASEVAAELSAAEYEGPIQALMVEQRPCIAYTSLARSGNATIRRQVVQTLVDGRMVTVRLEAFDRVFPRYQNAAFAVIASLREGPSQAAAGDDAASPTEAAP